jgi:hypothetical protein
MESPLHKIQAWTGTFFRSAELWEVGVYILLPHSAGPPMCQWLQFQQEMLERFQRQKDTSEQVPDQHTYEGPDKELRLTIHPPRSYNIRSRPISNLKLT